MNHPAYFGLASAEDKTRVLFNLFINRDLRRAALLGWIIPFSAALSRELMAVATAVPAASSSPAKISPSALVMLVLTRLRIDLFLRRLLSVTRTCFLADLVTGNIYLLSYSSGKGLKSG